jgi:2,3-bisphosphoglycerate-dependent phosphoglycerate mutase
MTQVYFVRHAEVDYNVHNNEERSLTEKGKEDTKLIVEFFKNKEIHVILSSPYKRALEITCKYKGEYYGFTRNNR